MMNSFDIMKKIICCDTKLKSFGVLLFNDNSLKTLTFNTELVYLEDNKPLAFQLYIKSPPNLFESGRMVVDDFYTRYHKATFDVEGYRCYMIINDIRDGGIDDARQQMFLMNIDLTIYKKGA